MFLLNLKINKIKKERKRKKYFNMVKIPFNFLRLIQYFPPNSTNKTKKLLIILLLLHCIFQTPKFIHNNSFENIHRNLQHNHIQHIIIKQSKKELFNQTMQNPIIPDLLFLIIIQTFTLFKLAPHSSIVLKSPIECIHITLPKC